MPVTRVYDPRISGAGETVRVTVTDDSAVLPAVPAAHCVPGGNRGLDGVCAFHKNQWLRRDLEVCPQLVGRLVPVLVGELPARGSRMLGWAVSVHVIQGVRAFHAAESAISSSGSLRSSFSHHSSLPSG